MIPRYLFFCYLFHQFTLVRASLITISHLLNFGLHISFHDLSYGLDHQGVHLWEQLELHVFLNLFQRNHLFWNFLVRLLEVVAARVENYYGESDAWDRKVTILDEHYVDHWRWFVEHIDGTDQNHPVNFFGHFDSIFPLLVESSAWKCFFVLAFLALELL